MLLVSLTCVVLGLFLLGANLHVIPPRVTEVAVNLWPLVLVACGGLLLADSVAKHRTTRSVTPTSRRHELAIPTGAQELSCRLQFSYGSLEVVATPDGAFLLNERLGDAPDPTVECETRGGASELAISLGQPLFPSHFQLSNTWHLALPGAIPLGLHLHLHEVALSLDLRELQVRRLDIQADQGPQEIRLGARQQRLEASIYTSSADLAIVVPADSWVEVRLLNPFCRVDFPQGDFQRGEDGSIVSRRDPGSGAGRSIEIAIDGALRALALDVEEPPEP